MTQEEKILKIEIPVEEETPFVPEKANPGRSRPDVKGKMTRTGKAITRTTANAAKKAWHSEPRRKVTRGAATIARKSGRFFSEKVAQAAERQARERATAVQTAVQTRIRETDWKAEAKSSAARSLRWFSRKVSNLAARMNASSKT